MRFLILAIFSVFSVSTKLIGSTIAVDGTQSMLVVDNSVYYLSDTGNRFNISDIQMMPFSRFTKAVDRAEMLGKRHLWMKIQFENKSLFDRQVLFDVGRFSRFMVVVFDRNNHFVIRRNGYDMPLLDAVELHNSVSFIIPSEMKHGEIIVRVDSSSAPDDCFSLRLNDYNAQIISRSSTVRLNSWLVGILSVMFLYHLFLYAMARYRATWFFSCYIFAVLIIEVCHQVDLYLIKYHILISSIAIVATVVAPFFYFRMMACSSLISPRLPAIFKVGNIISIVNIALCPAAVLVCVLKGSIPDMYMVVSIVILLIVISLCGISLYRVKESHVKYSLVGTVLLVACITVGVAARTFAPGGDAWMYIVQSGVVTHVLLSAFAILSRMKAAREQELQFQLERISQLEENLQLQLQLADELEDKLRLRTGVE